MALKLLTGYRNNEEETLLGVTLFGTPRWSSKHEEYACIKNDAELRPLSDNKMEKNYR